MKWGKVGKYGESAPDMGRIGEGEVGVGWLEAVIDAIRKKYI
jgi:hypothetical protein